MSNKQETLAGGRVELWAGDCLRVMERMAEDTFDAAILDPPYHLQSITKRFAKTGRTDKTRTSSGPHQRTVRGFMNTLWDGGDIAFRVDTWERVYRILKPGAYIVAFSSTRTFGRMSVAIEDAGFITHPFIAWIFGQGFPKAHRVQDDAWEGWRYGTQSLKPAIEPIYVGQKPFEKGLTGTANVRKWGCGAINIDGCRVPIEDELPGFQTHGSGNVGSGGVYREFAGAPTIIDKPHPQSVRHHAEGRWPSNVIHDGSDEVVAAFPHTETHAKTQAEYADDDASSWRIPVDSGRTYGSDSGSAARFFYAAKADVDDRIGSSHPTVKPVDLKQYLVRLVTPRRGLILDPFAGTGTTGEAALREGCRAVLIEKEPQYQEDIRRRMRLVLSGPDEKRRESIKAKMADKPIDPGPLFGGVA